MATIRIKKANAGLPPGVRDAKQERAVIYTSRRWRRLRTQVLALHPICELCGKNLAEHVHHIDSFMNYPPGALRTAVAFNSNNLQALCEKCHGELHGNLQNENRF
jgi:5-methylcytosine-specific restriction endonuclease McrA